MLGEDHPAYAGVDQRLGARAGPPDVVAGLERHDHGAAPGSGAGLPERDDLGMRSARTAVEPLADRRSRGVDDDRPDTWVGAEREIGGAGQRRA